MTTRASGEPGVTIVVAPVDGDRLSHWKRLTKKTAQVAIRTTVSIARTWKSVTRLRRGSFVSMTRHPDETNAKNRRDYFWVNGL
jgi:hypothetical protein